MDPLTPGMQTSEFKVTAFISLISAIIGIVDLVHPGFRINADTQRWIATVAVFAMSWIGSVYAHGRSKVKAAKLQADATVAASPLGAAAMLPNGSQQFNVGQVEPSQGGQF